MREKWQAKGGSDERQPKQTIVRYAEAKKAFNKAIEIKEDYAPSWYNLATAYSLEGNAEKALEDLEKAIVLEQGFKKVAKEDSYFKRFNELFESAEFKELVE